MSENNSTNVSVAFEMLLEEVEAEIDLANGIGDRYIAIRNFPKVKEALERWGHLIAFHDKVADLRREWDDFVGVVDEEEDEEARAERRDLGRLSRGQRTHQSAYYLPILEALEKLGGKGKVSQVLDSVCEIMKLILKKVDFDPLRSNSSTPRWRNTARWARNDMVQKGLLRGDSPHGEWQMTDLGRSRLQQHDSRDSSIGQAA
jgi:hypothetical protein